ncbi:unnamed protein product [Trichobilharzia regenti]|nr:unnamed protein product [Trichobilharzia regenti]
MFIKRVGSTNTDMNGIPVGQSTKVIRISSSGNSLNGNGNYNGEAISSTTTTPLLPSCVYDLNVPPPPPPPPPTTTTTTMMNSRAHPTPPPPPSIGNDYLNSNGGNNTNNNIASLVRQFEARFTFLDIGNIPVPKAYHGPKTYRSTASINHNINNNDGHRTQDRMYFQYAYVRINNGVRQGCSISPFLFNFAIDDILELALKDVREGGVGLLPGERLFDLEYAGDIVLLCDSMEAAQIALDQLTINVCEYGMYFAPSKCKVLLQD